MNIIDFSKAKDKYINVSLFDVIEKHATNIISVEYNYCELLISCISILYSVKSCNKDLNLSFNLKDGNILKLDYEDLITIFFRMYSYLGIELKECFDGIVNINMYLYELFILNQSMLNKNTFKYFNEIPLDSIRYAYNEHNSLNINCLRDLYNTAFKSIIVRKYNFMVNYSKHSDFKKSKYLKYNDVNILNNDVLNNLIINFSKLNSCCGIENIFLKPLLDVLYSLIN